MMRSVLLGLMSSLVFVAGAYACSDGEGASPNSAETGGSSGSNAGGSNNGGSNNGGSNNGGSNNGGSDVGGSGGATGNVFADQIVGAGCLPRKLHVGAPGTPTDGRIPCSIVEATNDECDCTRPGRAPASEAVVEAVRGVARNVGRCGDPPLPLCSDFCGCEILQLPGTANDPSSELYACQNQVTIEDPDLTGFCYIDADRTDANGDPAPLGNPEIVADCPATSRRQLRFTGADTPVLENMVTAIVCAP